MMKKKIISLLVAGVMMFGVTAAMGTGAWFTDNKTSKDNVFKAGTLSLANPGIITDSFTTETNIYPGWSEEKDITVTNNGTLDLQYKMALDSVTPIVPVDSPLYNDLKVSINNSAPLSMNALQEVYLGTIAANSTKNSTDTFKIKFMLPSTLGNASGTAYETSKSGTFNFKFTAAQLNDTSFTVNNEHSVIIKNEDELSIAINNQKDGQIWIIKSGNYGLTRNKTYVAGNQTGWYLPLTANNLTIIGVGNPVIYGNEYSEDGNWSSQNLVTAFGNNITLKGLGLMTKVEGNKTVEVVGANFRIEDCTIEPNTLCANSMYDNISDAYYAPYKTSVRDFSKQWGGSLYFSAAGNHVVKNVTIKNAGISFRWSPVDTHIYFENVNIINNSNNDFLNSYRYSGGFNNANCSITGQPKVTYVIDNILNNYNSVVNAAKAEDTIIDKVYDEASLKAALANNKISNIELSQDITLTSQASITRAVTIDGKNHAVKGSFSKTDNSNNSLLGIMDKTNGVTIKNLTADGTGSTKLHGINISSATDITLENVTVQNNPNSGVTVNSSMVTVKNITTKLNGWGGINVSLGSATPTIPAQLTVVGASVHQESLNDIWIDNAAWTNVNVIEDTAQYTIKTVNGVKCFNLNPKK